MHTDLIKRLNFQPFHNRAFILSEILIIETIKIAHPALILVIKAGKLLLDSGATKSILVTLKTPIARAMTEMM